jgi:thiol-disulfide isomerase/thioredoxin
MINFIKKNLFSALLLLVLLGLLLLPNFRVWVQSQLLMSPSTESNAITQSLQAEDWDLELKGINCPDAKLSDFKNKPMFLNFWATWCPPCQAEWPSIEALYQANKGQVNFVLVATNDSPEKLLAFVQKNNYTAPVYLANSPLTPLLLPSSFPTTFLIDAQGRIIKKELGAKDWGQTQIKLFDQSKM